MEHHVLKSVNVGLAGSLMSLALRGMEQQLRRKSMKEQAWKSPSGHSFHAVGVLGTLPTGGDPAFLYFGFFPSMRATC